MNLNLHPFRIKPIPILPKEKRGKLLSFTKQKINPKQPYYNECFVDIKDYGLKGKNHYYLENNPPYFSKIDGAIESLFLRKTVAEKFKAVNNRLKEYGVELFFFDCYRPAKVQSFFYDKWLPVILKKMYPSLPENELLAKRDLFTAKPSKTFDDIDINCPPPHSTGGAADVTLRFIETKQQLFMGTIFDDSSDFVFNSYYESIKQKGNLSLSDLEALKNRRILYWSLKEEGFENYPNEWWHYSFGDQMWAFFSNRKEAFYSKMKVKI